METRERNVLLAALFFVYSIDRHPEFTSQALDMLLTSVDAYRQCLIGTGTSRDLTEEILDFAQVNGFTVTP